MTSNRYRATAEGKEALDSFWTQIYLVDTRVEDEASQEVLRLITSDELTAAEIQTRLVQRVVADGFDDAVMNALANLDSTLDRLCLLRYAEVV